jgi:2-haloacid dehalogenase
MDTTILFDVNETLLDLSPVRYWFSTRFGDEPSAGEWFAELLRLSFVSSVTDRYEPFTELAGAALTSVAQQRATSIRSEDLAKVKGILATLQAHGDVRPGLRLLTEAGFPLAALTNSPLATAHAQLENANIASFFSEILSVEMVQRFKPHRSVYIAAADALHCDPAVLTMVAAHDWDIAGALAAGLDGAFIERPGQIYSPAFPEPTLTAPDITSAATAIISRYG